jgi:hypothetical protein
MAGLGRKVFTAGDVLTASDVQNYLMDQTIMNFAGTAARSSAIATPTTGMTTYIGTTGTASIPQIETYTGSAWQTPYGLTLLSTTTLSGSSVTINNVFSANYDSYVISFANLKPTTSAAALLFRMGTTATSIYRYTTLQNTYSGSSIGVSSSDGATYWEPGIIVDSTNACGGSIELNNPFLSQSTSFHCIGVDPRTAASGAGGPRVGSGWINDTVSYTSFTVFGATFSTGTVRVYGYRNS